MAIANPIYGKRKAGTIGMPLPDTLARVSDPDDPSKTMPVGEPGELALAGPQVMLGYWNRPDETAQVLKDGWLLTGDMAVMDEEGYFSIVDRKKDLIIAGGFNVYPREVEEVLYEHPKILECAWPGCPTPTGARSSRRSWSCGRASRRPPTRSASSPRPPGRLQGPRSVEFRDELPKTLIGKVLRRALVEEEQARQAKQKAGAEPRRREGPGDPSGPLGDPGRGRRILVVDNYDSFVFNLVQYLGELGAETVVWRNDAGTVADVRALDPDGVVISPGPGHPATPGSRSTSSATSGRAPRPRRLPRPPGHRPRLRRPGGSRP